MKGAEDVSGTCRVGRAMPERVGAFVRPAVVVGEELVEAAEVSEVLVVDEVVKEGRDVVELWVAVVVPVGDVVDMVTVLLEVVVAAVEGVNMEVVDSVDGVAVEVIDVAMSVVDCVVVVAAVVCA